MILPIVNDHSLNACRNSNLNINANRNRVITSKICNVVV